MPDSIYGTKKKDDTPIENLTEKQKEERELKRQADAVLSSSLGWKIWKGMGGGNFGIQTLNAAVIPPYGWDRAVQMKADPKLENQYYDFLKSFSGFFSRNSECTAEEYLVYRFQASEGEKSVGELSAEEQSRYAFGVFMTLVRLLKEYRNALKKQGREYIPLLCINKDTVYVEKVGNQVNVRLLVLPAFDYSHALEIPREADMGRADIRTDLYSAAYLYFMMQYGEKVWEELKEFNYPNREEYITPCLSVFSEWRMGIEEILKHLDIEGTDSYFVLPKENAVKREEPEIEKSTGSEARIIDEDSRVMEELKKFTKKISKKVGARLPKKKKATDDGTADVETVKDSQ